MSYSVWSFMDQEFYSIFGVKGLGYWESGVVDVLVLANLRFCFKGIWYEWTEGNVIKFDTAEVDEAEVFLFITSKAFIYRSRLLVFVNAQVLTFLSQGVYLGKSLYDIQSGDVVPLHLAQIYYGSEAYVLYIKEEGLAFYLLVGFVEQGIEEPRSMIIEEIRVDHRKGISIDWRPAVIHPYSLNLSGYRKLKQLFMLNEGGCIELRGKHLLPLAQKLIDRTPYRIKSWREGLRSIKITLTPKSPIELLYQYGNHMHLF